MRRKKDRASKQTFSYYAFSQILNFSTSGKAVEEEEEAVEEEKYDDDYTIFNT